jgi:hypothetical protein
MEPARKHPDITRRPWGWKEVQAENRKKTR